MSTSSVRLVSGGTIQVRTGTIRGVGPQGIQGATGTAGKTVLSGTTAPVDATGTTGDFYLQTTNQVMYGPKGTQTTSKWGTGVSIKGTQGTVGAQGPTNGAQGTTGTQGPAGPQGALGYSVQATAPTTPAYGQAYYLTGTQGLYINNGSSASPVQGTIAQVRVSASAPSGTLPAGTIWIQI